jgi:predicted ribosomally synthesized peptide with nif11-like leader
MSLESAKAFMDRMKNDENFRKNVTECENSKARRAFVENEGFDFSPQDLEECTGALSDEELDQIGGGSYCNYGGLDWHNHGAFTTCN